MKNAGSFKQKLARLEVSLNGIWSLKYCNPGEGEASDWPSKGLSGEEFYLAQVPGDIHVDLMKAKVIEEPLFGENAKSCEWMENKDWWYSRTFRVDQNFIQDRVELCFEGLDTIADVWLNGQYLGRSVNAFVPWTVDVTKVIRPGENLLVVRVNCGIHWAMTQDLSKYYGGEEVKPKELSRIFLRRAQFSVGWDWAPRLMTTGIWRSVKLRSYKILALRSVFLMTHLVGNDAKVKVQIEAECFADEGQEVIFDMRLSGDGKTVVKQLESTLMPGYNLVSTQFLIEKPRLWWPNGYGEPYLYDFTCNVVSSNDEILDSASFKYGIREVDLVEEPISKDEGQSFTIIINGKKVFCKGADWVPADSIMARVTPEKYERLIQEAAECNFNMLRVWGGGIYEDDAFYEACDRYGIMIWQDFMFACSYIPDDREDFISEVAREIELIIKRLRNHPCIVLWCGNNENQWIFQAVRKRRPFYGRLVYHELMPKLCARLDPSRPYWPSSPYGGLDVNSERLGDRHSWDIYLGRKDESRVHYKDFRTDRGKFITEFGWLAPPVMDTLKRCLPPDELWYGSPSWNFHNNTFERNAIRYALKVHFGKDVEKLSLEELLILSQVFQAEAYRYVINHFRRRKYRTSGVLFWCFNDCWGATSSWSIVDYYLNRKISFYTVKRAFAPIMVSFQEEDNGLSIWLVNDTLDPIYGELEYGWGYFNAENVRVLGRELITVAANVSQKLIHLLLPELPEEERRNRYYWVRFNKNGKIVSEDHFFMAPWRDLNFAPVNIEYMLEDLGNEAWALKVKSDKFAWMVEVKSDNFDIAVSDNYFNLFPKESYEIIVKGQRKAIENLKLRALNNILIALQNP
jgi:beta-mannosidase